MMRRVVQHILAPVVQLIQVLVDHATIVLVLRDIRELVGRVMRDQAVQGQMHPEAPLMMARAALHMLGLGALVLRAPVAHVIVAPAGQG